MKSWVAHESEGNDVLAGWIEDYFFRALDFVLKHNEFTVKTTLVGAVLSGLSHLKGVTMKAEFACALLRGMGANLNEALKESLAKEVFVINNPKKTYLHNNLADNNSIDKSFQQTKFSTYSHSLHLKPSSTSPHLMHCEGGQNF